MNHPETQLVPMAVGKWSPADGAIKMTVQSRPETGPMKFGDDWTGLFIRGDDAMQYAGALKMLIDDMTTIVELNPQGTTTHLALMVTRGLLSALESADEHREGAEAEDLHEPSWPHGGGNPQLPQ